jgi:hypothetical protein
MAEHDSISIPIQGPDITGQVFGRLTAIRYLGCKRVGKVKRVIKYRWLCRCECGKEIVALSNSLQTGHTKSCKCLQKEFPRNYEKIAVVKHGGAYLPECAVWNGMLNRCFNHESPQFPRYGGRGIKVCQRWRDSFPAFLEDMGNRPSSKHTIDRINNDGNYEPGNCRWATATEQANNRCNSFRFPYHGRQVTITEIAKELGLRQGVLWRRVNVMGMTLEEAVRVPSREQKQD